MASIEHDWTFRPTWSSQLKKLLVTLLKVAVSLSIIVWLVADAARTENPAGENIFEQLLHQPKQWGFLATAWLFCATAVMITFVRWWYLVRALGIGLKLNDALRICFWGYLFNLAPLGIVGGDALKAVMLAREYRGQRAKAIASVIVDRVIGLYLLFIVASAAILVTGFWRLPDIQAICRLTFLITAGGALGLGIVLTPGFTNGRGSRAVARIPRVGPSIEGLIDAVRLYSRMPGVLIVSSVMSVFVHSFFATGVYFIARGLPGDVLSLGTHFVIMPLSAATSVIPLPMGPFELVLEFLYTHVPEGLVIPTGQGLVVALGYRLITILTAAVGVGLYLRSRREVAEVMHAAEDESLVEPVV